ncbi:hypothetical protein M3Y94_00743200 [Aphelenchoides besseyi]|nr:hypothetical protein M3Y94_00743200 [Aphelenchoides besseyi]KAI6232010.1 Alpha-MPP [Aphelenchoides besseyi]
MTKLLRHRFPYVELRRRLSDQSRSATERLHRHFLTIPLTDPLPGYERLAYVDPKSVKLFDAKMTTLDNGLRVVTEPTFGDYVTLGVGINAGSRYEAHYPLGIAHFVEKLAFSGSENYDTNAHIYEILEQKGALIDCQTTKDTCIYASSCHVDHAEEILKIIADTVHRPVFTSHSVDYARQVIKFENEAAAKEPEPENRLIDWAHTAGFRGNTLGFSKFCDNSAIDNVDIKHLYSFISQYHTPDRIVVGAVGVNHERLVEWCERLFDTKNTIWSRNDQLLVDKLPPVDRSLAQYTGGELRQKRDLSRMARGPHPFPNLAHLMLGFEGVSVKHDDFVAFCVLQSLLGGGGSFSAGGPGKGMYSRLYTDVMHHYHWMYNSTAFNYSYADSGLFCIRSSQPPENLLKGAKIILTEFFRLNETDVNEGELQRAKTQLKSQLMMNLELRPVMFEDMTRQVLAHNERRKPQDYLRKIDAVRSVDIRRVTERMLMTKPCVVGYGDLRGLPDYENFDRAVVERSPRLLDPTRSVVFG